MNQPVNTQKYSGYLPHPSIQASFFIWVPSVIGLIVAIFPVQEYGFFQLLRIWITFASVYTGLHILNTSSSDDNVLGISFFGIAVFFNPIYPIYMQKELWIFVDIVCAYLFIVGGLMLESERREYIRHYQKDNLNRNVTLEEDSNDGTSNTE